MKPLKYHRCLIKLSGEALKGSENIFDQKKLHHVATQLIKLAQEGLEIVVVIGAGNIWRGSFASEVKIDAVTADYIGMLGTIMNALALESVIKKLGYEKTVICSSITINQVAETYCYKVALRKLEKKYIVIMAGGLGLPFFTTDTTATLRAAEMNVDIILMAKNNINGVYNTDPKTSKHAVAYPIIAMSRVISQKLKFMDLTAATLALEKKVNLLVFNIDIPDNIYQVAHGSGQFTIVEAQ